MILECFWECKFTHPFLLLCQPPSPERANLTYGCSHRKICSARHVLTLEFAPIRKPYKGRKEHEWWTPRWFLPIKNEHTKEDDWKYTGGYWDRKYKDTPDIF